MDEVSGQYNNSVEIRLSWYELVPNFYDYPPDLVVLALAYDVQALQLVEYSHEFDEQDWNIVANTVDNQTYNWRFSALGPGTGLAQLPDTLLRLRFRILTDVPGEYPVYLDPTHTQVSGVRVPDLPVVISNGRVTVLSSDPGQLELTGTIGLQGSYPGRWATNVQISLYDPHTGEEIESVTVTTDQEGRFTALFQAEPGQYQVIFKEEYSLAISMDLTLPTSVDCGQVLAGDANGDNFVTLLDFSVLASSFGSSAGDENYNSRADFNRDGYVTLLDFSLLANNFGGQGDTKSDLLSDLLLTLARKVS